MYNIIFTGGTLVNGTGSPRQKLDIGLIGDRIASIGDLKSSPANTIVDANGLFITPGFIDIHAHSDETLLIDSSAASKVSQGITTEISGNCGLASAPLDGLARREWQSQISRFGIDPAWTSVDGYLGTLEWRGVALNFGTLVGHAMLRYATMRSPQHVAESGERLHMSWLLQDCLEQGALGLSTGLFYSPGAFADFQELLELGEVLRQNNGIYTTHIRNECQGLKSALQEAVRLGEACGIPIQISHLKIASRMQWGTAEILLRWLDLIIQNDVDLAWDQYPYTAACNSLDSIIPSTLHPGNTQVLLSKLKDPEYRTAIHTQVHTLPADEWENIVVDPGWEYIILSSHPKRSNWVGHSIADIAGQEGSTCLDVALDLIVEAENQTDCIVECMDERDVQTILQHPHTIIVTDAEALPMSDAFINSQPHPRGFGAFPRVLSRYVREQNLLTWEEAIRKMTSLPASRFRIKDRGVLKEGYYADLVVFDPKSITDRATFDNPRQYSEGIHYLVINGQLVIEKGVQTSNRPGRAIRR